MVFVKKLSNLFLGSCSSKWNDVFRGGCTIIVWSILARVVK